MTGTQTQRYLVKHAYPKRPSEWTTMGADHYTVTEPLHFGRLHREPGDALCKPSSKFWGLDTNRPDDQVATCKRCIEIAARIEAGADTEVADRPRSRTVTRLSVTGIAPMSVHAPNALPDFPFCWYTLGGQK